MLRIPNPGSDIQTFIQTFQVLHEELGDQAIVTLDDMSAAMVRRNRASSSGFMGEEALKRSTRADRSLDPMYNQSKMYSELYRTLGWFRSTPEDRLKFSFTLLGAHVAAAKRNAKALFKQCLLGMAYPSPVLDVKGEFVLRPFACFLRTFEEMNGILCRDELIVGPLCLPNDRDPKAFAEMIGMLKGIRGSNARLLEAITKLTEVRKITPTTMGNYTRFPIAALEWTGWTRKEVRRDIYKGATKFLVLTNEGREELQRLKQSADIRAADILGESPEAQAAFCRLAFYEMLARGEFDTSVVSSEMSKDRITCAKMLGKFHVGASSAILFSPFQELDDDSLKRSFGIVVTSDAKASEPQKIPSAPRLAEIASATERQTGRIVLRQVGSATTTNEKEPVALFLNAALKVSRGNRVAAVDFVAKKYAAANKDEFYPLIAALFRVLGLKCEASPTGNNYRRWDALIEHDRHTIPIEIKSPGEEEFISVKGVRQALENKIVLLARKQYETTKETTSLVVGFNPPNNRSEVLDLIGDVKKAFGITIGVIDFKSLVNMSLAVLQGSKPEEAHIQNLFGIIDVQNS